MRDTVSRTMAAVWTAEGERARPGDRGRPTRPRRARVGRACPRLPARGRRWSAAASSPGSSTSVRPLLLRRAGSRQRARGGPAAARAGAAGADRSSGRRRPAHATGPDRRHAGAGGAGAVPRGPGPRPARRRRGRRPHRRPARGPRRRRRRRHARLDHQAADRDRGARRARARRPASPRGCVAGGKGRIVLVGGGDPFLASKPLPAAYPAHADVETLAARDRRGAASAGPDPGGAGVRRLAVLRAVVQPGLAGPLPARARGLADHRAVGRRGPPVRRLRAGRRPFALRRADLRRRAGRRGHRGGRYADPRRRGRRPRAGLGRVSAGARDRRAGAGGQRQRGRRGAVPPGRQGGDRHRQLRGRRGRRGPDAAGTRRADRGHRRVRRQRAVPREPDHPAWR